MGNTTNNEFNLPRLSVDLRIPLWGLLTALVIAAIFSVNVWMLLTTVADRTTEMQVTLKQVVLVNNQLLSETALLKFRMDQFEHSDRKAK